MATIYKFVSGDTAPQIELTLTREDSSVVDLTDATVYAHIRAMGSPVVTLSKTCVITDAENGLAVLVWQEGDLDLAAGTYQAEIEVEFDSGEVETVYELLQLQIREQLG